MGITAYTQIAATASNIIFFLVFVVAYYKLIKMNRRSIYLQEWQAKAVGRPQVIVDDDYSRLPEVDISIRNISEGAAKDITFEFSSPVESSDGTVISDLAYFTDGLDFLTPAKEITCHWDHLETLLPFLREKGLEHGIKVTTRYKDLAGESYETEWRLNPNIYRDGNYIHRKGMGDLVDATNAISAKMNRVPVFQEDSNSKS
ncbi:MAG TPA: hypothetical protein VFE21_04555 [Rubrobacteraceae bacterium]|nr:hypothetical protein [Rubrobacteraceae bacterium]